ncbi:MAG TPA: hypothetical protein VN738_05270 [Acidothermaceae bacterium]|jgi:hypothetical protein|nr:hypothetical protein [Acidothermaceae bacterium]
MVVLRAARAVIGAFQAWCTARYNRAIQLPVIPSQADLWKERYLLRR